MADEHFFVLSGSSSAGAHALRFLRRQLTAVVDGDEHAWRWVVIGAQQAVHDFVVAALPSGVWVMRTKVAKRFDERMHGVSDGPLPELCVDHFPELFSRMKSYTGWEMDPELEADLQRIEGVEAANLNYLRNEMVHPFPGAHITDLRLLIRLVRSAMQLVEHLGWKQHYSNHVFWELDVDIEAARRELTLCRALVDVLAERAGV